VPRLAIAILSKITPNDSIWVAHDLTAIHFRPSLKNNYFVELFAFRLVHIHHNNARFRLGVRREVFPNERLLSNRQRISIRAVITPVLR